MSRYYYDMHIHSCLSPCADNDNTPNNIAGMATLCGLNIVALTDHNSCRNCPAFFKAAKRYGIIPIAGMELTTAEDIHIICLFESLENALLFNDEVDSRRILIKNRVDIFGEQLICDEEDEVIATEENLLSNATNIMIDEVPALVEKYDGICYPAHIDRQSNGIIAVLGTLPETPQFNCVEFHYSKNISQYKSDFPDINNKHIIVSSDTHCLTDMRDKEIYFDIDDEPYSSSLVRKNLFKKLRGSL